MNAHSSTARNTRERFDTAPLKNTRVLIADSNQASQKHIKNEMSALGCMIVDCVTTPSELYLAARDSRYGLLFVDYSLDNENPGSLVFEELHNRQIPPPTTGFLAVTDNTRGQAIVSIAQAMPDEILIKPFSTEHVALKALAVYTRKMVLSSLNKAVLQDDLAGAERAYKEIYSEFPKYRHLARFLWARALLNAGEIERCEELIRLVLNNKSDPKLELILAEILLLRGKDVEAFSHLTQCNFNNPTFLPAVDMMAEKLWERDRVQEALRHLEKLSPSAHTCKRLRDLADLSLETGQINSYKTYLSKLVEYSYGTSMATEDDLYRMADLFFEQRKITEAMSFENRIRKLCNKSLESDLCSVIFTGRSLLAAGNAIKGAQTFELLDEKRDYLLNSASLGTLFAAVQLAFDSQLFVKAQFYLRALEQRIMSVGMRRRVERLRQRYSEQENSPDAMGRLEPTVLIEAGATLNKGKSAIE